ncbi:MAG TPA: alpha/beta hydrolase [Myxococcota bacterium]|nr:alpha/beta hydrolase [Myxococcota bacterium]
MTHELDPGLFDPARVDAATRGFNELAEKMLAEMPTIIDVGAAATRAARLADRSPLGAIVRLAHGESRRIPGPAGEIALRIFRPAKPRGVYVHIHGGGWALGAEDQQDQTLDAVATRTGLVAVSAGYRLAPEHPYPAGPDDCEAAALWVVENAARELGSGSGWIAIGGESAGAHLAVVTMLRLRDRHRLTPFRAANLVYGCYDLGLTPSVRRWGTRNLILSTPIVAQFADWYVPAERRADPDVSPLHADLAGLPPALFTVGTLDPLLDDTLFMASRWRAAGNAAELAVYPGGIHAFNLFPIPLAEKANARALDFLAKARDAA